MSENYEAQAKTQEDKLIHKTFPSTGMSMYENLGDGVARWTNGYSYMSTDKWRVPERHPPVCTTNKPSLVAPFSYATDLLQFEDAGKVTENAGSIDQGYTNIQNIAIPQH